jgi:hypothetical protein
MRCAERGQVTLLGHCVHSAFCLHQLLDDIELRGRGKGTGDETVIFEKRGLLAG